MYRKDEDVVRAGVRAKIEVERSRSIVGGAYHDQRLNNAGTGPVVANQAVRRGCKVEK